MRRRLSEEVQHAIQQEFVRRYSERFGEDWMQFLGTPLRPSPVAELAQHYEVSRSTIAKIRLQFYAIAAGVRNEENGSANTLVRSLPGMEVLQRLLLEAQA